MEFPTNSFIILSRTSFESLATGNPSSFFTYTLIIRIFGVKLAIAKSHIKVSTRLHFSPLRTCPALGTRPLLILLERGEEGEYWANFPYIYKHALVYAQKFYIGKKFPFRDMFQTLGYYFSILTKTRYTHRERERRGA